MWIEIFKTGNHCDSLGKSAGYSAETLDKIAENYNSKVAESDTNEAPLVKGHPKTDEPAYGWVEKLARRGDSLLAKIKNLNIDLINEVRKGMFKKVSIALNEDLSLRHVGLLGAVAPAVKGMKNVVFNSENEFNEYESDIFLFGKSETNFGINELDSLAFAEANQNKIQQLSEEIEELKKIADKLEYLNKEKQNENESLLNELQKVQNEAAQNEKENRLSEFREFTNALITNPQGSVLTPAHSETLIELLEMAYQSDLKQGDNTVFSENKSSVSKVKTFVSTLKPVLLTGEFAVKQKIQQLSHDFNPAGKKVSPERLMLHEFAKKLQEETPGLTYEDALSAARVR